MKKLPLIALLMIALPAHSAMFKCTSGGRVSYQETPCAEGATANRVNISAPPAMSSAAETDARAAKTQADQKKLSQAVRAKLEAGDVVGARAIAVTPDDFDMVRAEEEKQRKIVMEQADKRNKECARKAVELERVRKNAADRPRDSWWQNQVTAETEKYNLDCP